MNARALALRGVKRAVVVPHKSPGIMMKGGAVVCVGLSNGRGGQREGEREREREREEQLLYTRARVTETERLQYGGRDGRRGKESERAG